ncbi:tRNA lysidine(34) synthetase TilS [Stutzerimonas tarimensis]|uniref:tRNA(Ile)-lysidine synthase n=1 Tax=Stutzerimonas tarimensis TaxID=1507735 RepID=A0ABV7T1Q7_9GAMM
MSHCPLACEAMAALRPWLSAPAWRIAFSGGLDSTVLLHLLASLRDELELPPLSAIHVHHGLQPAADAWADHCRLVCDALGIEFLVRRVAPGQGASLENAARQARYAALGGCLGKGEALLTAQHRDDQAETLLYRLLRGSGVRGLAAIPPSRPFAQGHLLRPLLAVGRERLLAYATARQLSWVEDPSNGDQRFDRNYLRQSLLPALRKRWPQAQANLARTAGHMRDAQALLDELAVLDLDSVAGGSRFAWLDLPSLDLAALTGLSASRQRNLLRHWLADQVSMPDTDHWRGWDALRDAAADRAPRWRLAGGELVRGEGRIWFLAGPWLAEPETGELPWSDLGRALVLPGNGSLRLEGLPPAGELQVRYRQGGETMRVPERGERDLKRLLNEAQVPVFLRCRLPLLYCQGRLLAVANLPRLAPAGLSLVWKPPGLR